VVGGAMGQKSGPKDILAKQKQLIFPSTGHKN
jgi:hypothetical protein